MRNDLVVQGSSISYRRFLTSDGVEVIGFFVGEYCGSAGESALLLSVGFPHPEE